jgi:tetratricopeptide (TPR) repeat protein
LIFVSLEVAQPAFAGDGAALEEKDTPPQFYYSQGLESAVAGKIEEAQADFEEALKQGRADPSVRDALKVISDLRADKIDKKCASNIFSGMHSLLTGNIPNAALELSRASEQCPEYAIAYNYLGSACYLLGEIVPAIDNFRKAVQLDPAYASAYNNAGVVYFAHGDYQKAVDNYRKALEEEPDYSEANFNLAVVLNSLGRCREAIGYFKKAISVTADYGEAYGGLGIAEHCDGRFADARKSFAKAKEIFRQKRDDASVGMIEGYLKKIGG